MTVKEDAVLRPDKQPGLFGSVYIGPGASVLALDGDLNCHLVREWKYPLHSYSLEVISGGRDGEESFEECARRELREEAGLASERLIDLGTMETITTIVTAPVRLFLALEATPKPGMPGPDEFLEVVKIPFTEVLNMAMTGKLQHAATLITVLRAGILLKMV